MLKKITIILILIFNFFIFNIAKADKNEDLIELDIRIDKALFLNGVLRWHRFCEQTYFSNSEDIYYTRLLSKGLQNSIRTLIYLKIDFQEMYPNFNQYTFSDDYPQNYPPVKNGFDSANNVIKNLKNKSEASKFCNKYINDKKIRPILDNHMSRIFNLLQVYKNDFYKPQQIYSDVDNALFIQTDLGFYYGNIYTGITLDNYISTDPISQHNQKLYDIKVNKLKIMIELKKLKGLLW